MTTVVVLITYPSLLPEQALDKKTLSAEEFAEQLISEGIAACVNCLPNLTSIYKWQGNLERAAETLLIVKTSEKLLKELELRVAELHPYDLPEFISVRPEYVSELYNKWVTTQIFS
jgi:periplasmic divalent cation tolerance protein